MQHNLISKIYDCAIDPAAWPAALSEIANALGANGAMFFEVSNRGGNDFIIAPHISENFKHEAVKRYLDAFNDQEIIDQEHFARLSGANLDLDLISDTEFYPNQATFDKLPNVQAMMKTGLRHRAGTLLNLDCWKIDRFALQYSIEHGPITPQEKAIAKQLLPHIAKSLRVGRPLGSEGHFIALQSRLDGLAFSVAVVDSKNHLIIANQNFHEMLQDHDVFQLDRTGQLKLISQSHQAQYNALITQDDAHGTKGRFARSEALLFPTNSGALFVEICPANNHPELHGLAAGSRLITVFDSAQKHVIDTEIVSRFFPLTKTESQTLNLLGLGYSNNQIAEERNRSPETVKSQIKNLFNKTNTNNRTELVQLAVSLNSPFSRSWLR